MAIVQWICAKIVGFVINALHALSAILKNGRHFGFQDGSIAKTIKSAHHYYHAKFDAFIIYAHFRIAKSKIVIVWA